MNSVEVKWSSWLSLATWTESVYILLLLADCSVKPETHSAKYLIKVVLPSLQLEMLRRLCTYSTLFCLPLCFFAIFFSSRVNFHFSSPLAVQSNGNPFAIFERQSINNTVIITFSNNAYSIMLANFLCAYSNFDKETKKSLFDGWSLPQARYCSLNSLLLLLLTLTGRISCGGCWQENSTVHD